MAKSKDKMPKYPAKPETGRHPELTPEVQDKICDALRRGNYFETACAAAGIHKTTAYRWLKFGALAERGGDQDPTGMYASFRNAVDQAEAEAEARDLSLIDEVGHEGKNWQAIAWRLERRHPKKWGRMDRHEHTGKDGGPITFTDFVKALHENKEDDELG